MIMYIFVVKCCEVKIVEFEDLVEYKIKLSMNGGKINISKFQDEEFGRCVNDIVVKGIDILLFGQINLFFFNNFLRFILMMYVYLVLMELFLIGKVKDFYFLFIFIGKCLGMERMLNKGQSGLLFVSNICDWFFF